MPQTPHQRAEAALTAYGLTFPETTSGPSFGVTRGLYVRKKGFAVFGDRDQPQDALTVILKLPISAEMAAHLPFVREAKGWFKQHNWVIADFGPKDDVLAELDTLKAWLKQSYVAVAPKALSRQLD
ncbi:MAG: MmcQ/YjbR family DNA-binding protein [Phenylobacterium sp.]|uniref:MmcQ/YjbR family DNA-binding protein n=1 Tax=Phenylobacterium sp. TaxID=1871053 RepID=UPI0039193791